MLFRNRLLAIVTLSTVKTARPAPLRAAVLLSKVLRSARKLKTPPIVTAPPEFDELAVKVLPTIVKSVWVPEGLVYTCTAPPPCVEWLDTIVFEVRVRM